MIQLPKPDRRYKIGKIAKDSKGMFRGHPDTVTIKTMDVPKTAPIEMQLNPPRIATPEMAKFLSTQQNKEKQS